MFQILANDNVAPITFVGSATSVGSATNKPAGVVEGDLMLAVCSSTAANSRSFSLSGWTVALNEQAVAGTTLLYKVAGASEPSTYNFVNSGGGNDVRTIVAYRNAAFCFVGAYATSSGSITTAPEIMGQTAGSKLIAVFASRNGSTYSTPTGMSLVVANGSNTSIFDETIGAGLTGSRASNTASAITVGFLWQIIPSSYTPPTPKFIASASSSSSTSSLVISKPTGTLDGDLMIACLFNGNNNVTWTGDTGWTELSDLGANPGVRVAYKVASSEGSSYTFTASSNCSQSGSILTYRGAAYDAIGSLATGVSPLVVTGPSASNNYCKLIAAVGRNSASITITESGSMVNRVTDSDASQPSYALFDDTVGYGATGTRSFTVGSISQVGGVLLTIKPA